MLDFDNNSTFCYQRKMDNLKSHKKDSDLDKACEEYVKKDFKELERDLSKKENLNIKLKNKIK